MQWYEVVKTIKGKRYRYLQRTYRVGVRVKTENQYLGQVGPVLAGTVPVSGGTEAIEAVRIIDRSIPPPPSLRLDKHTRHRGDLSQAALYREEEDVRRQMVSMGVNTTNLKTIRLRGDSPLGYEERRDGYFVYGPSSGQRTAFKREFRRALAERWLNAVMEQQPERYHRLCTFIASEFSWSQSGAEPGWLALVLDWWAGREAGHREAVETLAEMLQRGVVATHAKYYVEADVTEQAEIRAWRKFQRLKQPAARKRQHAECQRLRAITRASGQKHANAMWVRRLFFDDQVTLSREESKQASKRAKKKKRKTKKYRYRRRRYPLWSR